MLQQSASRAVESHYPSTPAGNRTGVDLFIRENQRLRLSPAGHNFLRYSQQILALVDEARSVVAGDEPQGLFSLGSLESTAAVRIPATLAEFNRRYPKIQFSLSTGPSGTMLEGAGGKTECGVY